jgi:pimeloyl-ACP methyl ester carboxylesterase
MTRTRSALLLALLAATPLFFPAVACAAPASPSNPPGAVRPAPCKIEGVEGEARCATYPVWEDRAARAGRRIPLNIVILPALAPDKAPDPVFFLVGGPGQGATTTAGWKSQDKMRQRRDIVLIDQRGTGRSGLLDCDLYDGGTDLAKVAAAMAPIPAVRKCREELAGKADLTLYTTALAADDLDEVRAWLGYGKVNLHGGSYGTRLAQVYLKRHPGSVRTAILEGVAPLDAPIPLPHARAGQRAIDMVLADCAADPACKAAFPRLREELQEVFARLDSGVTVEVTDPRTGKKSTVRPDRGLVAEGIRFLLYGDNGSRLPLQIHRAAGGDLAPLVEHALGRRIGLDEDLATGLMYSVTCAEDLPFIDDAAAERETRGTLLGDYRIRQQKAVCEVWPRGAVRPADREPVRSDAPVLLLSGERDPVTPPELAERVARHLPNSLHVVFAGGGHGGRGDCYNGILSAFLERASAKGIDAACAGKSKPIEFALSETQGPGKDSGR